MDIQYALGHGSRNVEAVEINGATIRAMKGQFSQASDSIYNSDRVRVFHQDGRSFVSNSNDQYDVIYMFGVDTFAAASQGAYANVENFLYTTDALKDYFRKTTEKGIISIHRWGMVRESLRLFVEAFQALKELGVDEPEKHIIELTNQVSGWGQLIITKQKIDYKMLSLIDEQMSRWPHTVTQYSPKDLKAESASDNPYKAFVSAYLAGSAEKYISNFESDISPTSDDSPFFFKYYKLSSLFRSDLPPKNLYGGEVDLVHGYWPFFVMAIVAGQSVILTLLFIFTPMLIFKREGLKARGIFSVLTFFSCLGLGFMFVEIGLMQSLSLILGHPTYSMAAVLATMLIGAGAGSLIVAHFETKRLELFVFSSIFFIVSLALFICFRGDLNRILLGQNFYFRVMYAVAVSGGLSFSMGFFFPVGLGMARNISSAFVPWSWAVNAGFSVIGSMAAMLIAMNFGFQSVFEIALATYLVSFFSLFRIARLENGIGGK